MTYRRQRPHIHLGSSSKQTKEIVLRVQKQQLRHLNIQLAPQGHKGKKC